MGKSNLVKIDLKINFNVLSSAYKNINGWEEIYDFGTKE